MNSILSLPRVYTLSNCPLCEILKNWLKKNNVKFEEKELDTEVKLDLIMNNVFGNPPYLASGEQIVSSEDLFQNEILIEKRVLEVLNLK